MCANIHNYHGAIDKKATAVSAWRERFALNADACFRHEIKLILILNRSSVPSRIDKRREQDGAIREAYGAGVALLN